MGRPLEHRSLETVGAGGGTDIWSLQKPKLEGGENGVDSGVRGTHEP